MGFSRYQIVPEFGETAVGNNRQRCADFLQHTHSRALWRAGGTVSQVFTLLTLTSPDSLSLYWSPVTQPSSSTKLVTVPSKIVTLEEGSHH